MNQKPVKSDVYDNDWLSSAWGSKANRELLEQDTLVPRPRLSRALDLSDIKPKHKILDIACGRGEMPMLAAEKGAHAIGLDYSFAALEFAKKLARARGERTSDSINVELVRSDACSLPFADNSFDRITMLDIIEHLVPNQLESMFLEVRRVLKINGYAVIHTLPNQWVYDITFPMLNFFNKIFPKDPRSESEKKIHVNEQNIPMLFHTIKKCGLKQHIWLEQFMPAQARWNQGKDQYGDNRDSVYPAFLGPAGKALEVASHTPFKLILCNDIFGILWKGSKPKNIKTPFALTESITCWLSSNK
jgi:ubiquinone/menaquinone biosynthesis C-methylase UbiE